MQAMGIPLSRVASLVAAMGRHVAGGGSLPDVRWQFEAGTDQAACRLRSDKLPKETVCWQAESATRDFRKAKWTAATVAGSGPEWEISLPVARHGWTASLIELRYDRQPTPPLMLTTAIHVCPSRG